MISFLTYAVVILGVLAIAQLVRVFELTGELKGRDESYISDRDNSMNANLFIVFAIGLALGYVWILKEYGHLQFTPNASEHGIAYDGLMNFNLVIINLVFILTNGILFYFAWKYKRDLNRVPEYFTHSNKLELIWTVVPSIFLAVIIVYGLYIWNNVMLSDPAEDSINIELYSKQFDWTARYGGADNTLGDANVVYIEGANFVGVNPKDKAGRDDKVVKGEFHLPVNKEINFQFRSQDVIHSAYFPNFRVQMNTVPGIPTNFHFVPNKTTKQMKEELGDPDFEFLLLCNKICGASHYNMQMTVVVETEEEYNKWLGEQKELVAQMPDLFKEDNDKLLAKTK